jgi:ribosomal protein S27AE
MRICEGCGREYSPKSGKQRFCGLRCPGRGRGEARGFVPSLRRVVYDDRSCPYCGSVFTPHHPRQRFCCKLHTELFGQLKGRERYDAGYRLARRRWKRWSRPVAFGVAVAPSACSGIGESPV